METKYCFIESKGKYVCILYHGSVSIANNHNVESNLKSNDSTYDARYTPQFKLKKKYSKENQD